MSELGWRWAFLLLWWCFLPPTTGTWAMMPSRAAHPLGVSCLVLPSLGWREFDTPLLRCC